MCAFNSIDCFRGKVSKALMLGDDNVFASNYKFDPEFIKAEYRKLGLEVKVDL